jgi:hypothetical protein
VIGSYPEKTKETQAPGPRSPGRHICIGRQKTPEKGNFELAFFTAVEHTIIKERKRVSKTRTFHSKIKR